MTDYRFAGYLCEYQQKLKPVWGELLILEIKGGVLLVDKNNSPVAVFRVDRRDGFGQYGIGELCL